MDFPTHLRIGGLLYTYIRQTYRIRLHKPSFLWGCIEPDYENLTAAAKDLSGHHTYKSCLEKVLKMYETLPPVGGDQFSFRMGQLCHYLMDFSCYPHTSLSTMSPLTHILYEKQMGVEAVFLSRWLFKRMLSELPKSISKEVPDILAYLHNWYIQICHTKALSRQTQMAYDISFACISCVTVISAYLGTCSVSVLEYKPIKALPVAMFSVI